MEKPAAERVLEAWDKAVEAKRAVEQLGLDPIAILMAADEGQVMESCREVEGLIEAYGKLRKAMDDLAREGFDS